jgi:O-antigen/teichoic acid export membrane protein
MFVGLRTVLVQLVGLAGTIVIARHLEPSELGVLALGLTITAFGALVADGGLAAGLIRDPRPPGRRELRAALGLQLVTMTALVGAIAVVVWPFSELRTVTLLMAAALPITVFQTPAKVVLERELDYRRVAVIEVGESVAYYAWAAGAVLLGYGILGVASASLIRATVASGLSLAIVRPARVLPRFSWSASRGLLRFGTRYQAVNVTNVVRDQGINVLTAALAGTSALGLWTLAGRLLQAPMLVFGTLWRVSYPAMSKIVALGRAQPELLERVAGLAAIGAGALLCPIPAMAPSLVPALFGPAWTDTAWIVIPGCAALMIGGPVSVAAAGYLYAVGDAAAVLRAAVVHTAVWLAGAAALLPILGAPAVGVAWIAGSTIDAVVLASAVRRRCAASLFRPAMRPPIAAALAALVGWSVGSAFDSLTAAIAAGTVALIAYAGVIAVAARLVPDRAVADLARLVGRERLAYRLQSRVDATTGGFV